MTSQAARREDQGFFGHPRGLAFLAGTEVWERFSFFGMQSLLTLYLVHRLLLPGHVEHVVAFAGFRRVMESIFGPMTDLALASQIFGLYSGFTYIAPLAGAWLADRFLGKTRCITIGALMMSAGHLTMASERFFLLALLLLVIGTGLLTGNMAAQVGALYDATDHRRVRAYAIYLAALNVGALVSPLVCGTLGELYGWHYGFSVAGIGMLIGLATYLSGRRHLAPDVIVARSTRVTLTHADWRSIGGVMIVLIPYLLMASASNQAYNILLVWAEDHVERHVFGWSMPVTWLFSFDGLMTIAGIAFGTALWRRMGQNEPGDFAKIGIGCLIAAGSYVLLAGASLLRVAPLAIVLVFFVVLDASYVWSDPPTSALVSRDAPAQANAMMMAIAKSSFGVGYILCGFLGGFYERLGPPLFWLMHAGILFGGFLIVVATSGTVARLVDPARGLPKLEPEAAVA
jgi:POT family proton-dependent oligopeptide transporter